MIYQLFNAAVKNDYLSNVSVNDESTIQSVFENAFKLESELNKDIHDFNIGEVIQLLKGIKFENKNEAKKYLTELSNYIDWSIEQGIRVNYVNPMKSIDEDEFAKMFV